MICSRVNDDSENMDDVDCINDMDINMEIEEQYNAEISTENVMPEFDYRRTSYTDPTLTNDQKQLVREDLEL